MHVPGGESPSTKWDSVGVKDVLSPPTLIKPFIRLYPGQLNQSQTRPMGLPYVCHICRSGQGWFWGVKVGIYGNFMGRVNGLQGIPMTPGRSNAAAWTERAPVWGTNGTPGGSCKENDTRNWSNKHVWPSLFFTFFTVLDSTWTMNVVQLISATARSRPLMVSNHSGDTLVCCIRKPASACVSSCWRVPWKKQRVLIHSFNYRSLCSWACLDPLDPAKSIA